MENKKEIVILTGGGHKGIVKFQSDCFGERNVKGTCNLDFRPANAYLYLVGDNIAKIKLYDTNSTFEVPFCAKSEFGCVVRSSSITMFGGSIPNGKILKRIDDFNKQNTLENKPKAMQIETPKEADKIINTSAKNKTTTIDDIANLDEWTKYDGNNFYYAVKPQIDELFVCYPDEKQLNDAVENSKWVRIDAADDCYVVGVLFNDDEPTFICYGVPAKASAPPPEELNNACVWLPLTDEDGYWVVYQSAKTGEIVR